VGLRQVTVTYAEDANAEMLRGLQRDMHRFDSQHRALAVVYLYGDISGKKRDRAMVAAGYLATEQRWADADREWGEILKWARVDEFHATDFYACRGEFDGWKQNGARHIEAAKRFTSIAPRHELMGFAHGVDVATYQRAVAPELARARKARLRKVSPRLLCVAVCLHEVHKLLSHFNIWPRHERISILFEDEQGIGEAIDYFTYCKHRHEPWTKWFIGFGTVEKCVRPVQVADLLAHEAWRHATEVIEPTGRAKRKSFAAMLEGQKVQFTFATEQTCREMVANLRASAEKRRDD
jgi:hypothetical protein